MVKINWTRQAIEDIHEIREYYQLRSSKYSEQLTENIFNKATLLESYPEIGRIVPEIESTKIRELIYKNYRIVYQIISRERIDILAVHNGLRPLTEESIFE